MEPRTLHVSREESIEPSVQLARERWMLAAARHGESHLLVSTLAPAESLSLGAFHRRPANTSDVVVWSRHTGGRALPSGAGFLLVTLALPHRSALTSEDRLTLAPEQVMNRCVRGILHALRAVGVDVVYPGLDLLTHERRAVGALSFIEIDGPTLFQAVLATGRTLADGAFLLDRADPEGVVPLTMVPPSEAACLREILGPRGGAVAPEAFGRHLGAGYAEAFGVETCGPGDGSIEGSAFADDASQESSPPAPTGTGARTAGLLGTVEAWTTLDTGRIERVALAGDFLAPPDVPRRLSDALRGLVPDATEIERAVTGFLDRDRSYILGLRPSDLIDLLQRSARVAA